MEMFRYFIAIDLPEDVKEELAKVQTELLKNDIKAVPVKPEIFHLTLCFLGEIDDYKVNKVKEILKQIKFEKFKEFNAKLGLLGVFPSESFIRVLWISLEPKEKFRQIREAILNELKKLKIKIDERFESHVTLARIKWLKDKKAFLDKLKKTKIKQIEFAVDSIKLKKSKLTKDGPVYEDISVVSF